MKEVPGAGQVAEVVVDGKIQVQCCLHVVYGTKDFNVVFLSMVLYGTLWYSMVLYGTL